MKFILFHISSVLSTNPLNLVVQDNNYKSGAAHAAEKEELNLEEKIVKWSCNTQ